jgi:hypothetical protein
LSDRQDKKRNKNPDRNQKRREVPPPCGLLSVTQEEFFQFDFFFRPRLLLAGTFHSVGAAAAVCYYNNPTGSKRGRRLLLFKAQGTGAGVAAEGWQAVSQERGKPF